VPVQAPITQVPMSVKAIVHPEINIFKMEKGKVNPMGLVPLQGMQPFVYDYIYLNTTANNWTISDMNIV
jgi:hypothetical protein